MAKDLEKYKHSFFVPTKFVVGISKSGAGFPSMKNKDGKWTNLSIFERHCGFKPNTQRDPKKEVIKTFSQTVQEVKNVPIEGFKLIDIHRKAYCSDLYRDKCCVVLEDPRGWQVSIDVKDMQEILKSNRMNLDDGALVGVKLMYCWPQSNSAFTLKPVDENLLDIQKDTDEFISMKNPEVFIKPSAFEVGKIYISPKTKFAGYMFMYMGVHNVYSSECHHKAVELNSYKCLQSFLDDKNDLTHKDRHVFYCINPNNNSSYGICDSNIPGCSPYYVTSNLSKLFDKVVEDVNFSKYKMHNDNVKLPTYENVKHDMECNAFFNMLDFSVKATDVDVPLTLLEDVYADLENGVGYNAKRISLNMKAFPFDELAYSNNHIFLNSRNGAAPLRNFTIQLEGYGKNSYVVQTATKYHEYSLSLYGRHSSVLRRYPIDETYGKKATFDKLANDLHICMKQYVFCNGKLVPAYQNLALNRRTKYNDVVSYA